ncbi:MAG: aromatic amino acid lyase, partial [Acidimicrobiales bacterium]
MAVVLDGLDDFTLEHYRRVAFDGEAVVIGPSARAHMDRSRAQFVGLLDSDRTQFIYGVTSNFGPRARQAVPPEQQRAHARGWRAGNGSWARGFGGGVLEPRVVRGIVFARLANFVSGGAKVRAVVAERVAALLDGPLPDVPLDGEVGAGEVLLMAHVLSRFDRDDLEEGEGNALSNGSPVAAALAADAAVTGRRRLDAATAAFARSVAAQRAPRAAYEPEAVRGWGDDADVAAAERLLAALPPAPPGAAPQDTPGLAQSTRGIVAFLGEAERALRAVEHAASTSLRSVTDNPVYLLPDGGHPLGRAVSTGGYHNAMAYPAL